MTIKSKKFALIVGSLQVVFIVLFGLLTDYDEPAHAKTNATQWDAKDYKTSVHENNPIKHYYPMFQDVHVMMFIGFGFLMTFLRRYGYGAVGVNMLIAAFVIQWAMIVQAFFHHCHLSISIKTMLESDFAAAAVLISFGALLGKMSPLQMVIVALIEIILFVANEQIAKRFFVVADVGGSMFVHVFGAYFGLAAARVLYRPDVTKSDKEGSNYSSDLFSMIGTVFLWLYWPSFNSALAPGDDQHRAVINTYLALASCAVFTFAISSLLDRHGRFDMVHIQNATLAGGVAVGTSADMMIHPWGAMLIGLIASVVSVVGFKYITPRLCSKLRLHDTCGVNNLHGMPGLLAGVCGAVVAAFASVDTYGYGMYQIFPARAPTANNTQALAEIHAVFSQAEIGPGSGRSAGMQAGYQIIALLVTLGIALIGGTITGAILRIPIWDEPRGQHIFDDAPWWETPDDFNENQPAMNGNETKEKGDHLLSELA